MNGRFEVQKLERWVKSVVKLEELAHANPALSSWPQECNYNAISTRYLNYTFR